MTYRIHCQMANGHEGHGTKCFDHETAQAWVDHGNKEWPDIKHWMVAC